MSLAQRENAKAVGNVTHSCIGNGILFLISHYVEQGIGLLLINRHILKVIVDVCQSSGTGSGLPIPIIGFYTKSR